MADEPPILIIAHYAEGMFGFPTIYVSAPGAVILSVDENAPGDRVFQSPTRMIPAELLASLEGEEVHTMGDDPGKDARAALAHAILRGYDMPGPKAMEAPDERA